MTVENPLLAGGHEHFGQLRRQEALEHADPFGLRLRLLQARGHVVELFGQGLELIAGSDLDAHSCHRYAPAGSRLRPAAP